MDKAEDGEKTFKQRLAESDHHRNDHEQRRRGGKKGMPIGIYMGGPPPADIPFRTGEDDCKKSNQK
jgi:hypothetical protein